jgi:RimJ/RimL family protein N-acetyltransferase
LKNCLDSNRGVKQVADVILETERLILRPPITDDLSGWAALMADAEASRFIGGPLDVRAAWASLAVMTGSWSLQGFGNFSIIDKRTGAWMGRAGPWMPPGWPGPEIGWALRREYWGAGYAREASVAAIAWARDTLKWTRMIHVIHPENLRSIALAQSLGSSFEGRLGEGELGSPVPLLVFGLKF